MIQSVPRALRDLLDPLSADIREFVRSASIFLGEQDRVLDAGAGECPYGELFSHARYFGVDSTAGDPAWDYSRVAVVCDLGHLPFRTNTFRAVICTQVIEHVSEPQRVVMECARVLASGGRLFLTAPQGWPEHQMPQDYFRFTSQGLRTLMERAELATVDIAPMGGYFRYLANRLAFLPKILYPKDSGPLAKAAAWPFVVLAAVVFSGLLPLAISRLDGLDRRRNFTLLYRCVAEKDASWGEGRRTGGATEARGDREASPRSGADAAR